MEPERELKSCARCGGKFPGPGIEIEGNPYCCDVCATGEGHAEARERRSVGRWIVALFLLSAGAVFGLRYLARTREEAEIPGF